MDKDALIKAAAYVRNRQPSHSCADCGAAAFEGAELEHFPGCVKDREDWMRRVIAFSGLPSHKVRTFDGFRVQDGTAKALAAARLFCDPAQRRHHFLTLGGPAGVGKTHLAQAIGWVWAEDCKFNFRYVQAEAMLDRLKACFNSSSRDPEDSFDSQLNFLCKVPLLILDDLGTESSTDWARAKLQEIIDARYENGRLTVFTTNDVSKLPARIRSRLQEGVGVIIDAQDYRQVLAGQR